MARHRTVTHAYRLPGGWEKVRHEHLTKAYASRMTDEGFTMVRARRGFFDVREVSLSWYTG